MVIPIQIITKIVEDQRQGIGGSINKIGYPIQWIRFPV